MNIALAGNPNCGKTTLFNRLTGATARVGNWPGVTVDRREGVYKKGASRANIVDLPGIYSLSPYTPEEIVARDYLLSGGADAVINIVDATNVERNLYLTTQLLETDLPLVIALNMTDLADKAGIKVDAERLSASLGVPVVPICALRGRGVDELMRAALKAAQTPRRGASVLSDEGSPFREALAQTRALLADENAPHATFRALRLVESDILESARFSAQIVEGARRARERIVLPEDFEGDCEAAVANARYLAVARRCADAVRRVRAPSALTASDKVDRILTSRMFGLPIFLALMFFAFHLIFGEDLFYLSAFGLEEPIPSPGVFLLDEMGAFTDWVRELVGAGLGALGASDWVRALFVDGVFAGLGAILSFLPQILLLFLFLSLMEDSGYMARAAFLMDRALRKFGLSGKAFMPLLMCFGCLVPAMMGSRTLENARERRLMIMLAPFFSCGAKLPIWAMFGMAIFPNHADIAVFGIYLLGILTAIVAALILKYTIFRGKIAPFIMELPPYHMPLLRNVARALWEKLKGFLLRASTIIAGATVVIWFLSSFSFSLEMVEANSEASILGGIGKFLQPIFVPLGWASGDLGWKAIVAALTGLVAKEMVVSTMGVLYTGAEGDALEDDAAGAALAAALVGVFSPVAAVSFMAFNLLSVPCMAAVATAHAEMRSAKWTWIAIAFWISTAWVVSFLIYQIGSLIWG